jgi:hypothetical protein
MAKPTRPSPDQSTTTKPRKPALAALEAFLATLRKPPPLPPGAPSGGDDGDGIAPHTCIAAPADFSKVNLSRLARTLYERGVPDPIVLAEQALAGADMEAAAKRLGLNVAQTIALHQAALAMLTPQQRDELETAARHPRGKGLLPPDHPAIAPILRGIGVEKRLVTKETLARWREFDRHWVFLPRGPLRAVDHRPKLGPARDQGGRPTCTSFCATVVAEALEYLRDRRPGPRDFAEEFLWWYSKNGALITAGGYDGRAALYHYEKNGVCVESLAPYSGRQIGSNHAHVPVGDDAIDRAHDHRQPPLAMLPERDVAMVKAVLDTGRCVNYGSDTYNWNTATGVIGFPDPLDSRGVGGSHCTAIIGYIDRDDLPAHYEGGYFIIRNSWGGANSSTHLMGPEYGGHLLMPYGWYRRYTGWPATLGSFSDATGTPAERRWRAEFFANKSLRGLPAKTDSVSDVNFDWGSGGPFDITIHLPIIGDIVIPIPPHDGFSARLTQVRRLRSGWYRFTLRGDDGVRLWVDDRLVINGWKDQPATTYTAEHWLSGGDHVLRVEYYENTGAARLQLQLQAIEFHYELFANDSLSGAVAASFDDSMTDLEWRHAPPVGTAASAGRFSLRATGTKRFAAGSYRFHARHTGGCRIWVGATLVLDDWAGGNPNGAPVAIAAGAHTVKVEFAHRTGFPAAGVKDYYRAAIAFEWSEPVWHGAIHFDPARKLIAEAGWPNIDSVHEGYRVQGLTGDPVWRHDYAVPAPVGATYIAADSPMTMLWFQNTLTFGNGLPGGAVIAADTAYFSAIFTRRLFVPKSGRYQVTLLSDEAFRVVIDGNKVLERRYGGGDPFGTELSLAAGVHDIAVEYADAGWGAMLAFAMQPANWSVDYFSDVTLQTLHSHQSVMGAERIVPDRPATLGPNQWSARATRSLWLPVGRYRLITRADDGVRVKADGKVIIDNWRPQSPTTSTGFLEHGGGPVPIELEYFQATGGAELAFDVVPDGYLGEYYKGIVLDKPPPGSDWNRNPPVAYRFEPVIDFDWGGTGRLARVGSDRFSARWWGSVDLEVGRWSFRLTSDDGVRLFLDDRLLIDRWVDQSATLSEATIDLPAGRRELRVEYYEKTGSARCQLEVVRVF